MDQVLYQVRSYLIYRIHLRSILVPSPDAESGKVVVLANVDVKSIVAALKVIGDILMSGVVVGVGASLLFRVVGVVFLGPLALALASVAVTVMLGKKVNHSQRRSLEKTEKRLQSVGHFISNAKSVRISGLEDVAAEDILLYREEEVHNAALYRKILIAVLIAGKIPSIVPPRLSLTKDILPNKATR
jgi:ABC-type multidrug transport system fused ATPase/permease subunit